MRLPIVVLIFVIGFALAQNQPLPAITLPATAKEALRQGDSTVVQALLSYPSPLIDQPLWREAINYGLKARDVAPFHPEPYGYLGKVYSYLKFYGPAWEAYGKFRALGGTPDERQGQQIITLGRALGYEAFAKDDFTVALEYYLVAYSYAPNDEELNLQIARSYLGNNQADLASAYLRKLDATHTGDYSNYLETSSNQLSYGQAASNAYERGIKQYYLGNFIEARDSFAEATRLEPKFQKAFVWAGRVSLELSQPEIALPYWQQAAALQPDNADMQYFLSLTEKQLRWGVPAYTSFEQGMAFYNEGNIAEAKANLEQATQLNPNFSDAWAWLGRIAYENADYQTSYEAFDKANALASNETYRYFKELSAKHLGMNTPIVAQQPVTLEQAAPAQPVVALETISVDPNAEDEEASTTPLDETIVTEDAVAESVVTETIVGNVERVDDVAVVDNETMTENAAVEPHLNENTETTVAENTDAETIASHIEVVENTVAESAEDTVVENETTAAKSNPVESAEPTVTENTITENAIVENHPLETAETIPVENAVAENSVAENAVAENSVAKNSVDVVAEDAVSEDALENPFNATENAVTNNTALETETPSTSAEVDVQNDTPVQTEIVAAPTPDAALIEEDLAPTKEPLILLNNFYTYEQPATKSSSAVSFFATSDGAQKNWRTPTNYAEGTVYQRLEVSRKPSTEAVNYQLCLVPNDAIAVKPACSLADGLEFSDIGTYTAEQPLAEFYGYDDIDWKKGISNLMVILRDKNGNPINAAFAEELGISLDLFYPMEVRYTVVLVPKGGVFQGWP